MMILLSSSRSVPAKSSSDCCHPSKRKIAVNECRRKSGVSYSVSLVVSSPSEGMKNPEEQNLGELYTLRNWRSTTIQYVRLMYSDALCKKTKSCMISRLGVRTVSSSPSFKRSHFSTATAAQRKGTALRRCIVHGSGLDPSPPEQRPK